MGYTLGFILTCLLLALLAGGFTGWLTALFRSRVRERALQTRLEMQAARMESAERHAMSLSERRRVTRGQADQEQRRLRARIDQLSGELQASDARAARLEGELKHLHQEKSALANLLRKVVDEATARSTALEQARLALVRGYERLEQRQSAERAAAAGRASGGTPLQPLPGAGAVPVNGTRRAARADQTPDQRRPLAEASRMQARLRKLETIGPVMRSAIRELGGLEPPPDVPPAPETRRG